MMYLRLSDRDYPKKLLNHLQDPKPIYYSGNINLVNKIGIAVVGSRKCTSYGITVAQELGKLAAMYDVPIISGMARGIDSICQKSVLSEGGETIAVLGGGVDVAYPKSNTSLHGEIIKKGLIISEYPDGTQPAYYNFPVRNRIISALADVVVVVEASSRSGSLITAECAIEQGKEVYAIPGNITSLYSIGPNKLIRDGANPLFFLEDLFVNLGLSVKRKKKLRLGEDEEKVLDLIHAKGEIATSDLCGLLNIPISKLNPIITILEIKGLVYCEMGKVMIANFI